MKKYIMINLYNTNQPKSLKSYAFIICIAFCFISNLAFSAENIIQKNSSDLLEIENYLNKIKNLSADFIQESFDGTISEGKFFLSRPGRMRIEYIANPKILIIVNGSVLSYTDTELEETSYISTNKTPASFLTRKNISFSAKDVEVTKILKTEKFIKVSITKKNNKESGEFTLTFLKNPLRFSKMEVKNDLDENVKITLGNIDFDKKLSEKIFITKKEENNDELY